MCEKNRVTYHEYIEYMEHPYSAIDMYYIIRNTEFARKLEQDIKEEQHEKSVRNMRDNTRRKKGVQNE